MSRAPDLRRRALLAFAAALPARPARAAEPAIIVLASSFQISAMEVLNAAAGGHFAARGLDAEVIASNAAAPAFEQLIAGQARMARGPAVELLRLAATGKARLVSVGCVTQDIDATIVSHADRPLTSAAALRGKRVGVRAIRSADELVLDLLARDGGFAPEEIERHLSSPQPAAFTLLDDQRLDAVVVSEEVALAMQLAGMAMQSWPVRQTLPLPGQCCVVTERLATERPDLVRALLGGVRASMAEISAAADRAALLRRAASRFDGLRLHDAGFDAAVLALSVAAWTRRGPPLRHDVASWQAAVAMLRANGLGNLPEPGVFTTDAFVAG